MPLNYKPHIAFFSPLPPARSGIADYSRELLPYLARYVDLTLFVDDVSVINAALLTQFPVQPISKYPAINQQFDLNLYHMGNSAQHTLMFEMLRHYPGVVVLHDYFLHHFQVFRTLGQGDFAAYARELAYGLGNEGVAWATAVQHSTIQPPVFDAPLNERILDVSLGIIVHSDYVARLVRERGNGRNLCTIPALIKAYAGRSRRTELNLPPKSVIFASYGQITQSKQLERALRAFRRLRQNVPDVYYLLVGEAGSDVDVAALVEALGLAKAVTHIGYVAELNDFVDWIHTADIVVNLRYPTVGETSATALRALAAGRPLIVYDHGWYAEIPAEAALKLPVLDEDGLLEAMALLANDVALRQKMGQAGRRYTSERCHPEHIAEQYATFMHQILPGGGQLDD